MIKTTYAEKREMADCIQALRPIARAVLSGGELEEVRSLKKGLAQSEAFCRDAHGLHKALIALKTAKAFAEAIDADRNILIAIGLLPALTDETIGITDIRRRSPAYRRWSASAPETTPSTRTISAGSWCRWPMTSA